jgi:hypothetical protein
MVVRFTVNGEAMGREIRGGAPVRVRLSVEAPERIREVVLMKNAREHDFRPGRAASGEWEWVDEGPSGRAADYYYPRVVLEDGETAWGSPVWVDADA